ncbi:MAG TPA: cytochrome c oxidase subunit II [Gemmatimonadales bacterium]|jgi:cytochrome c oxidase subunit 2|nr:cytochrome c oxidase subunit II [Gemmatimonadales bacterium]
MSWISWMLPHGASTFARDIDWIYYLILIITGIAFFIVEIGLVWFLIKYRARPGRTAHYTHGSNKAEIIWTTIPAVTVVILGLLSSPVWTKIKGRDSVPANAIPIRVHVKQFEWNFIYPGPDGKFDTADDITRRNQLHVPSGQPVVVTLESEDVIHSFSIPAFRIKQDAVPGMHIRAWFQATEPGVYELGCAELCGLGHYKMRAVVTVLSAEEYRHWLGEQSPTVALK